MNTIQEFCSERRLPKPLEDAFVVYCRSDYAERFMIRTDGETTDFLVKKMTREQVADAWNKFINDLKSAIET